MCVCRCAVVSVPCREPWFWRRARACELPGASRARKRCATCAQISLCDRVRSPRRPHNRWPSEWVGQRRALASLRMRATCSRTMTCSAGRTCRRVSCKRDRLFESANSPASSSTWPDGAPARRRISLNNKIIRWTYIENKIETQINIENLTWHLGMIRLDAAHVRRLLLVEYGHKLLETGAKVRGYLSKCFVSNCLRCCVVFFCMTTKESVFTVSLFRVLFVSALLFESTYMARMIGCWLVLISLNITNWTHMLESSCWTNKLTYFFKVLEKQIVILVDELVHCVQHVSSVVFNLKSLLWSFKYSAHCKIANEYTWKWSMYKLILYIWRNGAPTLTTRAGRFEICMRTKMCGELLEKEHVTDLSWPSALFVLHV